MSNNVEHVTYFCYLGIWSLVVAVNNFNPIAGVVNLREKCHASCCRHLDHACDYSGHIQCHAKRWSIRFVMSNKMM